MLSKQCHINNRSYAISTKLSLNIFVWVCFWSSPKCPTPQACFYRSVLFCNSDNMIELTMLMSLLHVRPRLHVQKFPRSNWCQDHRLIFLRCCPVNRLDRFMLSWYINYKNLLILVKNKIFKLIFILNVLN